MRAIRVIHAIRVTHAIQVKRYTKCGRNTRLPPHNLQIARVAHTITTPSLPSHGARDAYDPRAAAAADGGFNRTFLHGA
eukprot:11220306-Lingulodinium_polyedra.AAC.1